MAQGAIPLSRDFSVKPAVLSPAGNALDLLGLLITKNALLPMNTVQYFSSTDAVASYFGTESDEYKAAVVYFNGAVNAPALPAQLLIGRYADVAVAGWTRSTSFDKVKISALAQLKGTLIADIDGTSVTSQDIDLSTATSFDALAQLLQAGLGDDKVTVVWQASLKQLIITSKTEGANSSVEVTGGTIAKDLRLTKDIGAIVSAGSDVVSATALMNSITVMHQDWVAFSTLFDCDKTLASEFAAWVNSKNGRYAYSMHDAEPAIATTQNADCNMVDILEMEYQYVIPTYGNYLHAVLPLAYFASISFDVANGRAPLKFIQFSGVEPMVYDLQTADNIAGNGYSFYGAYALNNTKKTYYADGHITGEFKWANTWCYNVWMNANLVASFAEFFTAYISAPFSQQGYDSVAACVIDIANRAIQFGAIRAGVTLDQEQLNIIKLRTNGLDIATELFTKGWYFYEPPQSAANRVERKFKGAIFFYCDGQDIQSIDMVSEVIQ